MSITFTQAKNGQQNAQLNKINFHSAYNPEIEAKRFADAANCQFIPDYILITEPALSYCAPYLKQKFPGSKLICVRYSEEFSKYNSSFDIILNYYQHKNDFENYFFNYFGEEKLFQILFLKWDASGKAFPNEDSLVWNGIKNSVQKAKTLLITREYFEKKWLLNSVNFFKYSRTFVLPEKTSKPVLIIASGPSLKSLLPLLSDIQNKFYIICLSSAISTLKKAEITPDLYLSTDGGYWAGQHLKALNSIKNIPLALPSEAYCPKKILKELPIVPLNYGDGLSSVLFKQTKNECFKAERNGTVSGTALNLAISLTDQEIYFSGLDLFASTKASHTEPNEIELNSFIKDNRITTKEKRITRGGMNNSSLNIYRDWFQNFELKNRKVFRIINNPSNSLGKIKDISIDSFIQLSHSYNSTEKEDQFTAPFNCNSDNLSEAVINLLKDNNSTKQLFPLDYTSLLHNPEDQQIITKIETKKTDLKSKLNRIINDL